jgi:hypothetical protein
MGLGTGIGAAIGGLLGGAGLVGGASEEMRSTLEEAIQNEEWGSDLGKYLKGDTDEKTNKFAKAIADGNQQALTTLARLHDTIGTEPKKLAAVGSKLESLTSMRGDRAMLKERQRIQGVAAQSRAALRAGAGEGLTEESRQALNELLKTYESESFRLGQGGAVGKAEALVKQLAGAEGGDVEALAEVGGIGAFAAGVGRRRKRIGALKRGAGMKEISRAMGGIPEDMREEIQSMIEDEDLSGEEKERLQKIFVERAARGGPGAGREGRKAATDRMTELMTQYTNANTKFVFAVGTAISGIETGELEQAAQKVKELQTNTGKNPAPSSTAVGG